MTVGHRVLGLIAVTDLGDARREGEPTECPQQSRDQCDGAEHRDQDRECRRQTHLRDERDTHHRQCGDGDHHRETREHNCRTSGSDGTAHGGLSSSAQVQFTAITGDDEQCVVDGHRDTEHGDDAGCALVDVEHAGAQGDQHDGDHHAEDAGDDRDERRHDGTEGNDHHHERDDESEHLGGAALLEDLHQ